MTRPARWLCVAFLVAAPAAAQVIYDVRPSTVANLPAAGGAPRLRYITDGMNGTDCSIGGGATRVVCRDDGAAWVPVSVALDDIQAFTIMDLPSGTSPLADQVNDTLTLTDDCPPLCIDGDAVTDTIAVTVDTATTGARGVVELATSAETTAGLAVQASDSRLSDSRTPTAHESTHRQGGSDALGGTLAVDVTGNAVTATTASAGDSATGFFPAGTVEAARLPDLSALSGAVTDSQVPDTITVSTAGTAGAFTANPPNCNPGEAARGVDASGAAEDCFVPAGVTDHGALTGLADDDHAGYARLAGRSGGQAVAGGTGASEPLLLQATAHATAGPLQIQCATYDTGAFCPELYVDPSAGRGVGLHIYQAGTNLGAPSYTDLFARAVLTRSSGNTGSAVAVLNSGTVAVKSDGKLCATNDSTSALAATDTCLMRQAANVWELTNGGSGAGFLRYRPTDTPPTCGDSARGTVYFDDSLGEHCGCRGATGAASWQQLDGGGAC